MDVLARADRLVVTLEGAIHALRAGIADGGLTVGRQRWLLRELREAPRVVAELKGAVDAYRESVTLANRATLPGPIADDARPLHIADEEVR